MPSTRYSLPVGRAHTHLEELAPAPPFLHHPQAQPTRGHSPRISLTSPTTPPPIGTAYPWPQPTHQPRLRRKHELLPRQRGRRRTPTQIRKHTQGASGGLPQAMADALPTDRGDPTTAEAGDDGTAWARRERRRPGRRPTHSDSRRKWQRFMSRGYCVSSTICVTRVAPHRRRTSARLT